METDEGYIQRVAGLTERQRQALSRYYGHLPESLRINAHRRQTELMRRLRHLTDRNRPHLFALSMLYRALHELQTLEHGRQMGGWTMKQAERVATIRLARAKAVQQQKKCPVRQAIETRHIEHIRSLRGEGLSWRQIAGYFKKYHRLAVSHAYLRQLFKELVTAKEEQPSNVDGCPFVAGTRPDGDDR